MRLNQKTKNKESEWFEKNLTKPTKWIYIPKIVFTSIKLEEKDEIVVKVKTKDLSFFYPTRVLKRQTNSGISFTFIIPKKYRDKILGNIKFKIIKLAKLDNYQFKIGKSVKNVKFDEFVMTSWVDVDKAVLWQKKPRLRCFEPIIVKYPLKVDRELLTYLGLYYCDGNKTGGYRLYASTKEIYKFMIKCYNFLIKNPKLSTSLRYDKFNKDKRKGANIKKELKKYWDNIISNKIDETKIEISTRRLNANSRSNAHLPQGGIRIIDGRQLVRIYHISLIDKILEMNNDLLTDFFIGGGLGDIYPSLRGRNNAFNWLEIATNKRESFVWKNICKKLNLNCNEKITDGNRVLLCINGYYSAIDLLEKGLFSHYKKRRDRCIYGLKNRTETYILKKLDKSSETSLKMEGDFIKKASALLHRQKGGDLTKYGLVRINYNVVHLTKKGEKFINKLKKLNIWR